MQNFKVKGLFLTFRKNRRVGPRVHAITFFPCRIRFQQVFKPSSDFLDKLSFFQTDFYSLKNLKNRASHIKTHFQLLES